MALYRENERDDKSYQRELIKEGPRFGFIRRESFFISDGGGQNGIRTDYVERRQAAQRSRPKHDTETT